MSRSKRGAYLLLLHVGHGYAVLLLIVELRLVLLELHAETVLVTLWAHMLLLIHVLLLLHE